MSFLFLRAKVAFGILFQFFTAMKKALPKARIFPSHILRPKIPKFSEYFTNDF